jgi:glycosyltransferase involved in cell wall biosynthesis
MIKKITFITVCLNAEKYIEKCIRSIAFQKTNSVEYIVLDGNSKDKTKIIIKKYLKYIDVYKSSKDKGMYHAMNKAVSLAKGKYLCFINSDDWLEKDSTKKVLNFLKNNSNFGVLYGDQKIFKKNRYLYTDFSDHTNLEKFMSIAHQSAFIKKGLFKVKKYSTSIKLSSDYDFFLYLYKKGVLFKKIPEVLSCFRVGGRSGNLSIMRKEFLIIQLRYNNYFIAIFNFLLRYSKSYLLFK